MILRAALLAMVFAVAPAANAQQPLVPGGCTEPAEANRGKPGCYLAAQLRIANPAATVHWQIYEYRNLARAQSESARHELSVVTTSHDRIWLHVLAGARRSTRSGRHVATIGPLLTPAGPVTARFLEATFTPGMRTRVHSHPGAEGFYVVSGVQCMESSADRKNVRAGETYIVPAATPHVQSAPTGRRNLALVLHSEREPWMSLQPNWTPSAFCLGERR